MRGLTTLVAGAGAVLSSPSYAGRGVSEPSEPSLHTTPDPGVPLVQENADKALKVAYMVLGGMCPDAEPEKPYHSLSVQTQKFNQRATTIIDNSQVIVVSAVDYSLREDLNDNLSIALYLSGISLEEIRRKEVSVEELKKEKFRISPDEIMKRKKFYVAAAFIDIGFDGHPNQPTLLPPYISSSSTASLDQNLYLSTLDRIITACEGTK